MSIRHPDSAGKVQTILLFEAVFHASASDCTKLTLGTDNVGCPLAERIGLSKKSSRPAVYTRDGAAPSVSHTRAQEFER